MVSLTKRRLYFQSLPVGWVIWLPGKYARKASPGCSQEHPK
jgi:hypothetical protein